MSKLDGSEMVLCVPRDVALRLGRWDGFKDDSGHRGPGFIQEGRFLPRTEELESDPSWLQVIPYGTIWAIRDGLPKCLVYRRAKAGTESRLHDLLSLGIGGHINPCDTWGEPVTTNAMRRELREETGITATHEMMSHICYEGLIWSESWTGVEAVHVGVYYGIYVPERFEIRDAEKSIDVVGWFSHQDLESLDGWVEFETWSRAALLGRILRGSEAPRWTNE